MSGGFADLSPPAGGTKTGGAVALRGLTKVYGSERVVDGFDAVIAAGEFFTLLGPSGSGKTTTLMMIAGFASIDAGELVVDGRDMAGAPPERRGFGMVFQNYAIFPHLDVFENVAFPLRARGVRGAAVRERVTWALDLVQLAPFAKRYARQLSGGQQQRVAIARAIVFQPGIVLMDEPLGALDRNLRYAMQTEIKEIQQRLGMTVIYVTHDQEEAMNMSDRVAIMNRGRVEQIGAPREVYEHPASAFAAKFLGEANLLDGIVAASDGSRVGFRLANGELLLARRSPAAADGAAGRFFVRPEKLSLLPADRASPHENSLRGEVRRVSFLGNVVRSIVAVGEITLTVDTTNGAGGCHPAVGDSVAVGWSADDGSILAGPGAS